MTWGPDYVTLPLLKQYQNIGDTVDDTLLAIYITTASQAVNTFCHRQFGQTATVEDREYETEYDRRRSCWFTAIDDVMDLDDLTVVGPNATEVTDYRLYPLNADKKGQPFTRIELQTRGDLVLSGKWGWTSVPVAVQNATLIQASRFAARRDSPFGIAGSPDNGGSELRLLATLDPDLKTALGSKYRREAWAS